MGIVKRLFTQWQIEQEQRAWCHWLVLLVKWSTVRKRTKV